MISEIDEREALEQNGFDIISRSEAGFMDEVTLEDGLGDDEAAVGDSDTGNLADSIDALETRTQFLSIASEDHDSTPVQRSRLGARMRARTSMSPRRAMRSASSPSPIRRFPLPRREPDISRTQTRTTGDVNEEPNLAFWTFVFM